MRAAPGRTGSSSPPSRHISSHRRHVMVGVIGALKLVSHRAPERLPIVTSPLGLPSPGYKVVAALAIHRESRSFVRQYTCLDLRRPDECVRSSERGRIKSAAGAAAVATPTALQVPWHVHRYLSALVPFTLDPCDTNLLPQPHRCTIALNFDLCVPLRLALRMHLADGNDSLGERDPDRSRVPSSPLARTTSQLRAVAKLGGGEARRCDTSRPRCDCSGLLDASEGSDYDLARATPSASDPIGR